MIRVSALTPRQEEILRWIGQGMPDGVMEGDAHRISAAALRSRGLIKTSGRGLSWSAKLTPAGHDYLARIDAEAAAGDGGQPVRIRYHPAVRALRDLRERHEVARESLPRALELVQALATEAERRGWEVWPASESENSYGALDWTGPKDGHLELEAGGHTMRLRIHEEGVHARGLWEDQVARFADVAADSPLRAEAPLPAGQYDAGATGRLKLELGWGEWWTRQQTRWADTSALKLEERLPEILAEVERRAAGGGIAVRAVARSDGAASLDAEWPAALAAPAREDRLASAEIESAEMASAEIESGEFERDEFELERERLREEHFGAVLDDESRRWEQAERMRRYLAAMERAYGDNAETADWVAWGRAHADRLDPLSGLRAPPRRPAEP
jgi:hypothetical protein